MVSKEYGTNGLFANFYQIAKYLCAQQSLKWCFKLIIRYYFCSGFVTGK